MEESQADGKGEKEMKRKAVAAVLTAMCLSLSLGACAGKESGEESALQADESIETEESSVQSSEEPGDLAQGDEGVSENAADIPVEETNEPLPSESTEIEGEQTALLQEVLQEVNAGSIYKNSGQYTLTPEDVLELTSLLQEVSFRQIDNLYLIEAESNVLIYLRDTEDYKFFTNIDLYETDQGYCMVMQNALYAPISQEINDFIERISTDGLHGGSSYWPDVTFTTQAPEPGTEEEYLQCAADCVEAWLKTCLNEDTAKPFRIKSYEMAPMDRNSYLVGGYVDGEKEFLAEVCFTAEYEEEATFYPAHTISHYTDGGKYWDGVYLKARFRYENGQVTMLTTFGNKQGLYGFQTSGYANFFEYARREDLQKCIEDTFHYYMGTVVSANQTITMEGKVLNLDIYQMSILEEDEDTIFGNPDFRTYDPETGKAYYSTGVYFTDMGTGTKDIRTPKDFKLVFDNYNNDGNPDYAVLYDSDENGSYYVLESIQNDGRVFNLSGRAYQGGVYVAGCFEPSVRLQRTGTVDYMGWGYNQQGELVPMARGSYQMSEEELPALNMYSDRLYLPGDLSWYGREENAVTCFLWNNTGSAVETDLSYEIQRQEGEDWVTVYEGRLDKAVIIEPREYGEMTFDLAVLPERTEGTYRVVQKAGDETAYGMFKIRGEKQEEAPLPETEETAGEKDLTVLKIQLLQEDGETKLQCENDGEQELKVSEIDVMKYTEGTWNYQPIGWEGYEDPLACGESRTLTAETMYSVLGPEFLETAYTELQKMREEDPVIAEDVDKQMREVYGLGLDCTFEEFKTAVVSAMGLNTDRPLLVIVSYTYQGRDVRLMKTFGR